MKFNACLNTFKDMKLCLRSSFKLSCYVLNDDLFCTCFFLTAKKFGVNEFVNPKDYDKPVQQVGSGQLSCFILMQTGHRSIVVLLR